MTPKDLYWLTAAIAKDDDKPALQRVQVGAGAAFATDGLRLHALPCTETPGLYDVDQRTAKDTLISHSDYPNPYPDCRRAIANARAGTETLHITIPAAQLIDALKGQGNVRLTIHRKEGGYFNTTALEIQSEDKYALIMGIEKSELMPYDPLA